MNKKIILVVGVGCVGATAYATIYRMAQEHEALGFHVAQVEDMEATGSVQELAQALAKLDRPKKNFSEEFKAVTHDDYYDLEYPREDNFDDTEKILYNAHSRPAIVTIGTAGGLPGN